MADLFKVTFKRAFLSLPMLIGTGVCAFMSSMTSRRCAYANAADGFGEQDAASFSEALPDREFLLCLMLAAAVLPVFFTGREMTNGTVKNKLICGVGRLRFYLTHLLVNIIMNLIVFAAATVPMFVFCPGYFRGFQTGMLVCIFGSILVCVLYVTALSTLLAAMFDHTAVSLIICLGVLFAGVFIADKVSSALTPPENNYTEMTGLQTDPSGRSEEVVLGEKAEPNPDFVGGTPRKLLWSVHYILPVRLLEDCELMLHQRTMTVELYREQMQEYKESRNAPFLYERYRNIRTMPIAIGCAFIVLCVLGVILFRLRNIK